MVQLPGFGLLPGVGLIVVCVLWVVVYLVGVLVCLLVCGWVGCGRLTWLVVLNLFWGACLLGCWCAGLVCCVWCALLLVGFEFRVFWVFGFSFRFGFWGCGLLWVAVLGMLLVWWAGCGFCGSFVVWVSRLFVLDVENMVCGGVIGV